MTRDLDTRARQAVAGLKAAVEAAELTSMPPVTPTRRRSRLAVLRPAIVMALLLIGATVGVAVVMDSSSPTEPAPPVTTTMPVNTTSFGAAEVAEPEPSPPTSAYIVPVAPTTTVAPDLTPPHIEITFPEDGAELETKTVTFTGITEPGARVFAGPYEAEVESSGEWHIVLILNEGSNVARFTAVDAAGNESEAVVTVYYVVEESTTTTVKELAEFTANAMFGSCSETPPFDVYYGTGEPGSIVEITSEYGSGSTKVGEEGNWEKKVFFETAPPNETFVVTVSDEFGRSAEFEFVYQPA